MVRDFTLKEIAGIVGGRLIGKKTDSVCYLATDSRILSHTNHTLFVAIDGERHDGHRFLKDVYSRGIRSFLVSKAPESGLFPEAGFCYVEDTQKALQLLGAKKRELFSGTVVGITGSNGKTIVKEWIFQCLRDTFKIVRSPKSYNSQIGVPLSAWMIDEDYDLAILEAGISQPGEMEKLEPIISPDIGILTNIGAAHQENFNSFRQKLEEKLILFKQCKKIIYCSDIKAESVSVASILHSFIGEKISWSLGGEAKYIFEIMSSDKTATIVRYNNGKDGSDVFELPFSDEASIENALNVVVFMLELGLSIEVIADRISRIEPVSMRLELLKGIMGSILLNDSYNADLAGLTSALDLLTQQEPARRKIVILSDLLQSGKSPAILYREVAGLMRFREVARFIGIGPDLMANRDSFPSDSVFYPDVKDFIKHFNKTLFQDSAILIKGSRSFKFELITDELQLQAHQTTLQIDLNAMVHNLNHFRSLLKPGVRTMVVVKALSYGSGSTEIASLLQFHKVDYLAVAFVDEGVTLRNAGIYLPIMVLNPALSSYSVMMDYQLEPELYSLNGLEIFINLVKYRGEIGYPVHIKLDTGMHRLGFEHGDISELKNILGFGPVHIKTVFTHLAASDEAVHDSFSNHQIKLFEQVSDDLMSALDYRPLRHVLNSAGIVRFPEAQFDMVRLGIGLHGIGREKGLQPVSSFMTRISQIKYVKSGETIGYSRSGKFKDDGMIATIPVGYADGLCRSFSNGAGGVWVDGQIAPIIGNICMDMTMIDVSGLNVVEGAPVEIFGKNLSVSKLAGQIGAIPYEILTGIPERVKRIYLQE